MILKVTVAGDSGQENFLGLRFANSTPKLVAVCFRGVIPKIARKPLSKSDMSCWRQLMIFLGRIGGY
jgi:hypothetical protein